MRYLRETLAAGEKIRVLVVDDSVVARRMISRVLETDPAIHLVGIAANGLEAIAKVEQLRPHVVTLDVEMPELDGLGALREIVKRSASTRVIMVSSLTSQGAEVTMEALMHGASDYIAKPAQSSESTYAELSVQLLSKVRQFFCSPGEVPLTPVPISRIQLRPTPEICAIGVSTGGPAALLEVMPAFPKSFPVPIVIVQHMPANFTRMLAERLDGACSITVAEGTHGMILKPGHAVIAPGGFHMRVVRAGRDVAVHLDEGPKENSCRPAVDVLFRSIVDLLGGRAIAAILTGMGQDGLEGARRLKARGGVVLAQDEASSIVWGMPGAIVTAGLADAVLSLHKIVPELVKRTVNV